MPYMATFTINIPQMLAYIPYIDPMGIMMTIYSHNETWHQDHNSLTLSGCCHCILADSHVPSFGDGWWMNFQPCYVGDVTRVPLFWPIPVCLFEFAKECTKLYMHEHWSLLFTYCRLISADHLISTVFDQLNCDCRVLFSRVPCPPVYLVLFVSWYPHDCLKPTTLWSFNIAMENGAHV